MPEACSGLHGQKISLVVPTRASADEVLALLDETELGEAAAIGMREEAGSWHLEIYVEHADDSEAVLDLLQSIPGAAFEAQPQQVPAEDWVTLTQTGLSPVRAGGFIVHGSHDRHRIMISPRAIEIDAGRAFGTAHHGTTRGCLIAIDRLCRRESFNRVLDLGSGSGVLAIAAARRLGCKVTAVDIDPIATMVARQNCRNNRVGASVRTSTGDGTRPAQIYTRPYGLVVANILAGPLIKLSSRLRELTMPGGYVILSGLLNSQAREVIAAYRARGFSFEDRIECDDWSTITMRRSR
jgi:ribosomal protein L11 methyltransferase